MTARTDRIPGAKGWHPGGSMHTHYFADERAVCHHTWTPTTSASRLVNYGRCADCEHIVKEHAWAIKQGIYTSSWVFPDGVVDLIQDEARR